MQVNRRGGFIAPGILLESRKPFILALMVYFMRAASLAGFDPVIAAPWLVRFMSERH